MELGCGDVLRAVNGKSLSGLTWGAKVELIAKAGRRRELLVSVGDRGQRGQRR